MVSQYDNDNKSTLLFQKHLAKVETAEEMNQFLKENVNWEVHAYPIVADNSFRTAKRLQNQTLVHCGENIEDAELFVQGLCTSEEAKSDGHTELLYSHHWLYLVMGIVAFVGNGVVIFHEIKSLRKRSKKSNLSTSKEKNIYKFLVLNLSLADFLMSVYLIVYSVALHYSPTTSNVMDVNLCEALGVMSVLSSQVSVTVLVVISGYRLRAIIYPYKQVRMKLPIILISLAWAVWLVVAAFPLFNIEFIFAKGIVLHDATNFRQMTRMPFWRIRKSIAELTNHINDTSDFGKLLHTLSKFPSKQTTFHVLSSFGFVNFETDNWNLIGYYDSRRGCTLEVLTLADHQFSYFSMACLLYNFLSFLFILIAYIIILKDLSSTRHCMRSCFSKIEKGNSARIDNTLTENKKIYYRIFLVVFTDMFCWMPVCVIGFVYFVKFLTISDFYSTGRPKFRRGTIPLVVMALVPINSVVNPYIYSYHFWKKFVKEQIGNHNFCKLCK